MEALPQQLSIGGVHVAKTTARTSCLLSPAFLLFVHGHRAGDKALNSLAENEIHYCSVKYLGVALCICILAPITLPSGISQLTKPFPSLQPFS